MPIKELVTQAAQAYSQIPGTGRKVLENLAQMDDETKLAKQINVLATTDAPELKGSEITRNFIRILNQVVLVMKQDESVEEADAAIVRLGEAGEKLVSKAVNLSISGIAKITAGFFTTILSSSPKPEKSAVELHVAFIASVKARLKDAQSKPLIKTPSESKMSELLLDDGYLQLTTAAPKEEMKLVANGLMTELSLFTSFSELPEKYQKITEEEKLSPLIAKINTQLKFAISTVLKLSEQKSIEKVADDCNKLAAEIEKEKKENFDSTLAQFAKFATHKFWSIEDKISKSSCDEAKLYRYFKAASAILDTLKTAKLAVLPRNLSERDYQLYLFHAKLRANIDPDKELNFELISSAEKSSIIASAKL